MVMSPGYDHLIPPAPSDRRAADAVEVALARLRLRPGDRLAQIYKPATCPNNLLETMYWAFRAEPLYWAGHSVAVIRRIYSDFYLPPVDGDRLDGILPNKNARRALALFSRAVNLSYRLEYRRSSTGKKLGVTLYVTALNRAFYDMVSGGQEYLETAYRFLMPARLPVDDVVFETAADYNIYIRAEARLRTRTDNS